MHFAVIQAMDVTKMQDLSTPRSPPRLVVVHHEEDLQAFILADGTSVNCGNVTAFDIILNLIAAYYAWDLTYPKNYQVVSFFQTHLLADQKESIGFKSSALIKLEKSLKL